MKWQTPLLQYDTQHNDIDENENQHKIVTLGKT